MRLSSIARAGVLLADVLGVELALLVGYALRIAARDIWPIDISEHHYLEMAVSMLAVPISFQVLGLYAETALSPIRRFTTRFQATLCVFAMLIAWDRLVMDGAWSRGVLLISVPLALAVPALLSGIAQRVFIRLGWWGVPVVILGAGSCGRRVAQTLRKHPVYGLTPVAYFDDDPSKWKLSQDGLHIEGPLADSASWAKDCEAAIICMPTIGAKRLAEVTEGLHYAQILIVPDFVGMQTLWLETCDLGGLLGLSIRQNLLIRRNRIIKRFLDYALAVPALLLCGGLILLFAAWIGLLSKGSPFFGHVRPGKGGKLIKVWKLRTMYEDAGARLEQHLAADPAARAEWETRFKLRHDPRILPMVGTILRKTSIDELPQLWNVIKGEMSLVGPRPFPQYHLERFPDAFQSIRMSVLPGITGLWQVSSRSEGDLNDQEAEDTFYIRNWSLWMDLYVIAVTPFAVLSARGAR